MHTKLRVTLAVSLGLLALSHATTSRADEGAPQVAESSSVTTTSTQTAPPAAAPASTTTTTAAPYVVVPSGDYGDREISRTPNRPLLSTGTTLFVLSYGASVVTAAVSDRDEDKKLFIPVVGPWIDLADRNCDVRGCGGNEDVNKAMIITSGVVQGAGVLLAIGSLFIPETVESRRLSATKPEVRVLPLSFAAGAGVGAVGRF